MQFEKFHRGNLGLLVDLIQVPNVNKAIGVPTDQIRVVESEGHVSDFLLVHEGLLLVFVFVLEGQLVDILVVEDDEEEGLEVVEEYFGDLALEGDGFEAELGGEIVEFDGLVEGGGEEALGGVGGEAEGGDLVGVVPELELELGVLLEAERGEEPDFDARVLAASCHELVLDLQGGDGLVVRSLHLGHQLAVAHSPHKHLPEPAPLHYLRPRYAERPRQLQDSHALLGRRPQHHLALLPAPEVYDVSLLVAAQNKALWVHRQRLGPAVELLVQEWVVRTQRLRLPNLDGFLGLGC